MDDFEEIKNIDELCEYMGRKTETGESNSDKLLRIGYSKNSRLTKIIYDYGNGEEKVIKDDGVVAFIELFERIE